MKFPLPISLGAAWPLFRKRRTRLAQRSLVVGGWIWSKGYHCPVQLCLAPMVINACVPLVLRLLLGGVQSPHRHSGVTRAFIFKGFGCSRAKMGQRERGGNEDFGLQPHHQDYNPQPIKGSVELVFRDALPAPLNLYEGSWLSVPGTALCLNSCPSCSGGWGLEICLNICCFLLIASFHLRIFLPLPLSFSEAT